MKIRIDGYESPHVLKALAALLINLANEPRVEEGCAEPCGKPEPLPGRATAYEPFDIFPADVMGGNHEERGPRVTTGAALPAGYEVVGQVHDETLVAPTGLVIPPPSTSGAPEPDYSAAAGYIPSPPVALDKTGTPWDARIHSSSRALVANGTWRLKKGVDKTLVESVTRETREPVNAAVNTASLAQTAAIPAPPLGLIPLPPAPPLPFNEISRFFAVHCMAGKLTHADMEAMAKHSGVEYTQDLMTAANADKRPAALAYLQSLVDSRA